MSLIISVYVREGIVMAADSRLTLTIPRALPGGQAHTLSLVNQVALVQPDGQPAVPFPVFGVPFEFFTLQDAIDFAVFGIRSTIETLRFQNREKTVGGPIDVLVVTPGGAQWIRQKQLVVEN